jgi:hypothetical protein
MEWTMLVGACSPLLLLLRLLSASKSHNVVSTIYVVNSNLSRKQAGRLRRHQSEISREGKDRSQERGHGPSS